jgi:hypothetical protein
MEALLVKVFATALALSLVMTRPDAVKTQFDPATDKAEVMAVLGAGCDAVKKSFDIENIDLDGLIDTVMVDKQAAAGEIAGFKGIKFDDLHLAYKQLCKHEKIDREVIDLDHDLVGRHAARRDHDPQAQDRAAGDHAAVRAAQPQLGAERLRQHVLRLRRRWPRAHARCPHAASVPEPLVRERRRTRASSG